jgi:hypothetical protein
MKMVVPALAVAFIATIGASSAAQASTIDFSFAALGNGITASPEPLQDSTSLNLDGSVLVVTGTGAGDASGLAPAGTIMVSPTNIIFGSTPGPLAADVFTSWTGTHGSFTETLTTVSEIDRDAPNAITVTLTGTLVGAGFADAPVTMIFDATQSGGPGNVISVSGTDSISSAVPELSTWAMMALGFGLMGFLGYRKTRSNNALPIRRTPVRAAVLGPVDTYRIHRMMAARVTMA